MLFRDRCTSILKGIWQFFKGKNSMNESHSTVENSEVIMEEMIDDHMQLIDKELNELNVPVKERPFQAAIIFVEVAVLESTFGSKEELLRSESFANGLLPRFYEWYRKQYGNELVRGQSYNLCGIVHFKSEPIELCFSQSTMAIETNNESAWMAFPDHFEETETVQEMLVPDVDIRLLSDEERIALFSEVSDVVGITRRIGLRLMTAELDGEQKSMAATILTHLAEGVSNVLTQKPEQAAKGCWEFHLAIEKSYKVLIGQKLGKSPRGHNLLRLDNKARELGTQVDKTMLTSLPTDKEVIAMRYGEKIVAPATAARHYRAALSIVGSVTAALSCTLNLANSRFLLKKAPWAF